MEYEGIVELLKKRMSEDLHSIILFGSATRPEDFAPGYSTIDLLILVKRKIPVIDRMKMIRELAGKANLIFLTPREFMVLAEDQHPLVLLSIKDSKVLVDDGTFTELSKNVRVGEKALKYFKSFSYTYLSLALESLLRGNYLDTPHYLYHVIKNIMRYRLVAEKGLILCSDKEVVDFLESLYGKKEAELFKMVRKLRKSSRVSPILCSSLFLEVLEFFSKSYGVKKGGINEVYKIAREKPVVRVDIKEEEKRLIYYLQVLDEEGRVERKVL